MPEYSIIVPVYKAEKVLSECVDSILNQEYKDFELILVDDGSPDDSGKICDEYAKKDARVKVIHKENGGVSSARNVGIDASVGKYITFLDSDDFVDEKYFDVICEGVAPGFELFSFGMFNYLHKEDGSVDISESNMNMDITIANEDDKSLERFIVSGFFASPCNKVFLSSVIKENKIKFKEGVVCFEDYMFCLEYLKHAKGVRCVSTPIYYYRNYESVNHVSKRRFGERFYISRLVFEETEKFIESKGRSKHLFNLHRYTYQAYMTEMRAVKQSGKDVHEAVKAALKEAGFIRALKVITPRGKLFRALTVLVNLGMYGFAEKLLLKRI